MWGCNVRGQTRRLGCKNGYLGSEISTKKCSPEPETSEKETTPPPPREHSMAAMYIAGIMSFLAAHRREPELKYKLRKAKPPAGRRGECQIHLPDLKRLRNKKVLFIPSFIHSFIQQPFIE